jgi:hypothetical protein
MEGTVAGGDRNVRYRRGNGPDHGSGDVGQHLAIDQPVVRPLFMVADVVAYLLGLVTEVHIRPSPVW